MKKNKYNPLLFESNIQKFWLKGNFLRNYDSNILNGKTFSMIMPPPNITGILHLGHAWDSYFPDTLMRYKKMRGYKINWFSGMDHAGIATQSLIEKKILLKNNINIKDFGKDKFLKEIWNWKKENQKKINEQWNELGILPDPKVKFTLDDDVNEIVIDSFIKLYEKGLIYNAKKIVNWDIKLQTAISNIEVEYKEVELNLYDIKYKLKDLEKYLIISTTRPETIFGDTAIFVNPNDSRYKKYIGKKILNPLNNEELEIMADEYVKEDFGTGVMKVTPSHDFNDYDLGVKYKLKFKKILNIDGTLNSDCGKFSGLSILDSRKKIVSYLTKKNLITKVDKYFQNVGYSQRSKTIVQPLISSQWFLDLKQISKKVLLLQKKKNGVSFFPKKYENEYLHWLKIVDEWCISRQLWWGHKMPIWFSGDKVKISKLSPGISWKQTDDVLDTWFSSSLLPLIFYDKENVEKSNNSDFYSDSLFTGYDIIFFWVSKMIFQNVLLENKFPFKNILIHGLIRDEFGRKMSKSLGNGIDPSKIIGKYGSDSLRLYLISGSSPGEDLKFTESKLKKWWEFCNKIYNISSFFQSQNNVNFDFGKIKFNLRDKFLLKKLNDLNKFIDKNLEKYNLPIILKKIKYFVFDDFANSYLEDLKVYQEENKYNNGLFLFVEVLKLIHPFAPFITEKLYLDLNKNLNLNLKKSILEEKANTKLEVKLDKKLFFYFEKIREVLKWIKSTKDYNQNLNGLVKIIINNSVELNYIKLLNLFFNDFKVQIINNTEIEKYSLGKFVRGFGYCFIIFEIGSKKSKSILINEIVKFYEFECSRSTKIVENLKNHSKNKKLVEREIAKRDLYCNELKEINENNIIRDK